MSTILTMFSHAEESLQEPVCKRFRHALCGWFNLLLAGPKPIHWRLFVVIQLGHLLQFHHNGPGCWEAREKQHEDRDWDIERPTGYRTEELVGRIDNKPRQGGGGRDMSYPLIRLSQTWSGKIARWPENLKKNHDHAGGEEPLKLCVHLFYYLGKKVFETVMLIPRSGEWRSGGNLEAATNIKPPKSQ